MVVAAAHDTERCGDGTLARGQYRTDQQHLGFPPGRVGKQRCEGNENSYNGIGQSLPVPDTGVSMAGPLREKCGQASSPCSYTFAKLCVKSR